MKNLKSLLIIVSLITLTTCVKTEQEEINSPPVADFSISPEQGNTDSTFIFDASLSTDKNDPLSDLIFTWEIFSEYSGILLNDFENKQVLVHQFSYEGDHSITLEVEDPEGLVSTKVRQLIVAKAIHYPDIPFNPLPQNEAIDQELTIELKWQCSHPVEKYLKYKIYFGDEENPPLEENAWYDNSYTVYNLEFNKNYYWKVVASDWDDNTTEGPVWKFSTKSDVCSLYWQVCEGDGLNEASDYPGSGSIHPIMICGADLEIPASWQSASVSETELVACISRRSEVVEVCNYTNGGKYTRYKLICDIELHEARTGALVASTTLNGGVPSPCPGSLIGMSGWNYGSSVSDERIIDWLKPFVE